MEIHFHGAARTVTGSQHLLRVNGHQLLLDCGLYQGPRQESRERNSSLPFAPDEVDAVLLSHAHIDHSGNLPSLVKKGYRGPIHTTHASADLAGLMVQDSGKIQENDAEFLNKRAARNGGPCVEPLYTQADARQAAERLRGQDYGAVFEPVPGVQARFVEAGHILGSGAIVLDVEERGRRFRLAFSGDIGRQDLPLLRDPEFPRDIDHLIMECTYGDKVHRPPEVAHDELCRVVRRAVDRGGKVIVPAFAVGRTQEIVYSLNLLIAAGEIPRIPVYVDSPLAVNVSDVFREHTECFDQETSDFVRSGAARSALGFDLLTYVRSVEESKALNDRPGPMVIISASGMAETGRVLHHLRNNIEDPRNTVLIVSWQAPYTLGRRLADREKKVRIFGEEYKVKAEVATISGFSAHAGRNLLLEYAGSMRPRLKNIFLVHGEPKPALALKEGLRELGFADVLYPERHQAVEL